MPLLTQVQRTQIQGMMTRAHQARAVAPSVLVPASCIYSSCGFTVTIRRLLTNKGDKIVVFVIVHSGSPDTRALLTEIGVLVGLEAFPMLAHAHTRLLSPKVEEA